jgi:hypothetical protein
MVEAVPAFVSVTPPTVALPLLATALKVPAWVAAVGGLATKFNVGGRLGLLIVTVSPPVKSVDENVAEKVPVPLATVVAPL